MGDIADTADLVWRDNDGATPHKPVKSEIRDLFGLVDDAVGGVTGPPGPAGPQGPVGPAGAPGVTSYTAPGGTFAIPIDDKLDEVVSVTGWMSEIYDDTHDHTAWLLNVIDKVHSQLGGACVGITMPHPKYNISGTLQIPWDNITWIGRGAGANRTTLAQTRASALTRILWTAGTAAPMVEYAPTPGPNWYVIGGGLRDIMLDGNGVASRCLSILTSRFMRFVDVHCFAAAQAMIYTGQISGVLTTHPVYGSAYHSWERVRSHAVNAPGATNTAYALHMVGGQAAGGAANPDNSTINQFRDCQFTAEQNHAVRLENADGHEFYGGAMTSHTSTPPVLAGGLVTGHAGLELCSSSQSTGFQNGVARNIRFFGPQINDVILRACQTAIGSANSPHEIEFYGWQYGNAGGFVYAETPGAGLPAPHAIFYDQKSGITVYGNSVNPYRIHGLDHMHMIEAIAGAPGAEDGYVKQYVDPSDGSVRVRWGPASGSPAAIRVMAPKQNVMAQSVTGQTFPNGASTSSGVTFTNAPVDPATGLPTAAKGNPTKWIPILDGGTTRYIPAW